MNPVISVIGTLYEERDRAEKSLDIWTRQKDCPAYELIILDDNSTDGAGDTVEKYRERFPAIRYEYFKRPTQRSCIHLLNYGVKTATGEWVCIQWYDRIPASFYLLRDMWEVAKRIRGKAFVSAENAHIGCTTSRHNVPPDELCRLLDSVPWRDEPETLMSISNVRHADNESACFMMRKNEFVRIGGYDERYTKVWGYPNVDLYDRVKQDGFCIVGVPTAVCHQSHDSSGSMKRVGGEIETLKPDTSIVRNVGREWGVQTPTMNLERYTTPNKYTSQPSLREVSKGIYEVRGYNGYLVNKGGVRPIGGGNQINVKDSMLRPWFADNMNGKTVLDLGCATGYWSILALKSWAKHVTALDMDAGQLKVLEQVRDRFHWEKIETIAGDYLSWKGKADIVLALALIHWIYSCTAFNGSLDAAVGTLADRCAGKLLIEWIEPDDPAINMLHHTSFNRDCIKEPYDKFNFAVALGRHFRKVKLVGKVTDKREIYEAVK